MVRDFFVFCYKYADTDTRRASLPAPFRFTFCQSLFAAVQSPSQLKVLLTAVKLCRSEIDKLEPALRGVFDRCGGAAVSAA